MIDASQEHVNGVVCVKLYKGNVTVAGRKSEVGSRKSDLRGGRTYGVARLITSML